jgi:xanthine/uracil permease
MTEPAHCAYERLAKALFAAMAVLFVLAGLVIHVVQTRPGIDEDTARLIATAFLATGIADTLVLYRWDRIFKRRARR